MIAPDDRPKSWSGGKIRRRRLFLRAERNTMEQLLFAPWLADALDDARSVRVECDAKVLPLLQAAFPKARIAGAGTLTPADLIEDACADRRQPGPTSCRLMAASRRVAGSGRPCSSGVAAAIASRADRPTIAHRPGLACRPAPRWLGSSRSRRCSMFPASAGSRCRWAV